ncbi:MULTISPECIES: hypothetical protein [unclassified Enterococcus]|uniref:hypothetical protein n=1 Tax=unclassified Enterococcus TaxID=2608891 RepID=UPI0013EBE496|nr:MULTISPECIES: hypothetical protein [unclassified Enterococcus]
MTPKTVFPIPEDMELIRTQLIYVAREKNIDLDQLFQEERPLFLRLEKFVAGKSSELTIRELIQICEKLDLSMVSFFDMYPYNWSFSERKEQERTFHDLEELERKAPIRTNIALMKMLSDYTKRKKKRMNK